MPKCKSLDKATSADGTEIPFTCLRGADADDDAPTLVYAYGGAKRGHPLSPKMCTSRGAHVVMPMWCSLFAFIATFYALSRLIMSHLITSGVYHILSCFVVSFQTHATHVNLFALEFSESVTHSFPGFGIPLLPNYNATIGAAWLERGGQYVEATAIQRIGSLQGRFQMSR